ncbi:MAG: triose-phosphate isomerase [bacterium]|nr:triose-phosphate isomerase [bacterium]
MAKPILVANWKNHPNSLSEAQKLLKEMSKKRELYKKVALFIAPPQPYLESTLLRTRNFAKLASQNFFSPEILKSFGVRLAIIGHSDYRALGESSEIVSQKIKLALRASIVPLVCIGESVRDVDGEHFEFLREELKSSLSGLKPLEAGKIAIAYEPIWTIGKRAKDALSAPELAESVIFIKKVLTQLFNRAVAEKIPILYGGSVEPANAGELMVGTGVRGFLVGHASLSAKSFETIAKSLLGK